MPYSIDERLCTCTGCWSCTGHVAGCTCDIDWDKVYGHEDGDGVPDHEGCCNRGGGEKV